MYIRSNVRLPDWAADCDFTLLDDVIRTQSELLIGARFHTACAQVRYISLCTSFSPPPLLSVLPLVQPLDSCCRDEQPYRNTNHGREPLGVTRRFHLLPDDKRQPSLYHVCHLVHSSYD